ncbi:MAG: UDP-N-acetylmuramoyl-L-alanine--D-glutamate ligase [Cyclobacteriaceae bacterium]|nr:UDP-N-acetylmuramoyl-L-alanine--D-glutamate ligase [Cyclobacteriaceae bacterium]MDW8331024.1 UDP-N-acetylmuramoyl-L-alanine--D-glutamate ligase [Cyclobacteriaceae bacterium]
MKERIVILGAGESGTGAALLAQQRGYDVFVSDSGAIKSGYRDDLIRHKIEFEEEKHTEEKILNASLIIKSPGIPDKVPVVMKAKQKGIEVIDEIEFAFRFLKGRVIAITGTNGKTTTTLLTYHLLKSAGFDVALAGNVGESLARKLAHGNHSWYVLEISSFQLDGTKTFRPDIGILLNITPDHLDRYNYEMKNYINSKFRLAANMTPADAFIYYADDAVLKNEMAGRNLPARVLRISFTDSLAPLYFDGEVFHVQLNNLQLSLKQSETTLRGRHNAVNTLAAVGAALLAGVKPEAVMAALKTFKNAPHRLEHIATIRGVEFVNDSKATNVDSVIYALGSYKQPLIWIAGGIDKGNDYNLIKDEVKKKVKALICLGKDNEKLKRFFTGVVPVVRETQSVKELVRMALDEASAGDVVLLSPACASFDLFKNYEDRGNQFRQAVLDLKKELEQQPV